MVRMIHWACSECGRVMSAPEIGIYTPNTICQCRFPEFVTLMQRLEPVRQRKTERQ